MAMNAVEGPWFQEFEEVSIARVELCSKHYGFVACPALNSPVGDSINRLLHGLNSSIVKGVNVFVRLVRVVNGSEYYPLDGWSSSGQS
jgi:hypothetical protein